MMNIAEKGKTKEMFQKNLSLLNPQLKEALSQISDDKLWDKIKIEYNDEGYPLCRYKQNNTSFLITSMQPVQEVEKASKDAAKKAFGSIFLFGSGFGYPIFKIFEYKTPQTSVVVFEQDLFLFKAMLHYFDFEPLSKTGRLFFLAGDIESYATASLQMFSTFLFLSCTRPTLCFTPVAQRNFKTEYIKIYKHVFSQLSLITFYMGNDHLDSLIGLRNMVANTGEILYDPYIGCLKDQYRGIPAFIIANGPSLDKNIQQLKNIKGNGLILSVESAIVPLIKNGIVPDILTICERTEATYTYHFKNRNYPKNIALICLCLVDPHVFPSFHGPKIPILRSGESLSEWFNQYLGDGESIDAGSNVSHLATELASYLGADPIVFVGQDYAYGPQGVTHSKDAVYNEKKGEKARKTLQSMPIVSVHGNNGDMIPSNQLWVNFRMNLESKIALHPDNLFLNATEGGAIIKGTKCETLENIIKKYCVKPLPCRVDALVSKNKENVALPKRKKKLAKFIKSIKEHEMLFKSLIQIAIERKQECAKAIRLARKNGVEKNLEMLKDINQKNLKAHTLFAANDLCLHFTEQIFIAYDYLASCLRDADIPDKIIEVLKLQYNSFCYLGIVCQSLLVNLENAEESLTKLLNAFDHSKAGEHDL